MDKGAVLYLSEHKNPLSTICKRGDFLTYLTLGLSHIVVM
nr:MAG TPA: hypothetical protein [Bacteriophage sp.]